jgi:sucrose phosphorylase
MNLTTEIVDHLVYLYGPQEGRKTAGLLVQRLQSFPKLLNTPPPLDEKDAFLITYGDQFQKPGEPPLKTLETVIQRFLKETIQGIHILPFFPYSSDDGFSVIDYAQVDPRLGSWEDISTIAQSRRLMVDGVINHISQSSAWFQQFLQGDPRYADYFIPCDPHTDLSLVVRPRALPLLTPFDTARGREWLWTTFSADQIDLNYRNPQVLLEITFQLLDYVARGAQVIRLDAIAYLWKEIGTGSIHLPQTHHVIQFWRSLLNLLAPHVLLITETNVPHLENISYFGNGQNEAQLVYNFALPPLVLHTFTTGNSDALTQWAAALSRPSSQVTFFNFLASHDGIGVNPVRGILQPAEIDALVEVVQAHGGLISYKNNPDGSRSPYELNISYFDAISNPAIEEPGDAAEKRFLASQAILLAFMGLPGIYVHSLFGSQNWNAGVVKTGMNRTINREKFLLEDLEKSLNDPFSRRSKVFSGFRRLLRARSMSPAFHPYGDQKVLSLGSDTFALLRQSPGGSDAVLCLHEISGKAHNINLREWVHDRSQPLRDLVTGNTADQSEEGNIRIDPYQVVWLELSSSKKG